VLTPGRVVVEWAVVADASLRDGVGPVSHRPRQGEQRVAAGRFAATGGLLVEEAVAGPDV
jgi:hypothetical protein